MRFLVAFFVSVLAVWPAKADAPFGCADAPAPVLAMCAALAGYDVLPVAKRCASHSHPDFCDTDQRATRRDLGWVVGVGVEGPEDHHIGLMNMGYTMVNSSPLSGFRRDQRAGCAWYLVGIDRAESEEHLTEATGRFKSFCSPRAGLSPERLGEAGELAERIGAALPGRAFDPERVVQRILSAL